MPFSLIPDGVCPSIYDLDYEALARRGVRLVLADLDNTLIPYSEGMPDQALTDWLTRLRGLGMELFVVSNSRKSKRVPQFCQALGVPYIRHAGKPRTGGYYKALEQMGCQPHEAIMLGDQLFTDCLGARIAGVPVCLVRPIEFGNPFRFLRYAVELPFRAAGKGRTAAHFPLRGEVEA